MGVARFTVAILAGGRASRLGGVDKGLAPLAGQPLIRRLLAAVRAMPLPQDGADTLDVGRAGVPLLIVANRNLETYARHAEVVTDAVPDYAGPLAGVASALAHARTPWVLTLPVDCPAPPAELAARLLGAAQVDAGSAFVAHDGTRRQPLFALYQRHLAPAAAAAAQAGQGVWQWQDGVGVRELDFSDRHAQFRNLNTPEDFLADASQCHDP